MKKYALFFIVIIIGIQSIAQNDKAEFSPYKAGFYFNVILKQMGIDASLPDVKVFKSTFDKIEIPSDTNKYEKTKYLKPLSQGMTGTCWCFATTSFMESEVIRLTGKNIKLSEMWTVYWEYVDRAAEYVKSRGGITFTEGSEASSIPVVWAKYGIVPNEAYIGKASDQPFHNHRQMIDKMSHYLDSVKEASAWNSEKVVADIKVILNKYMGEPPTEFVYNNKKYNPQMFMKEELKINPSDYYHFMSTLSAPFMQKSELVEDDNWRHFDDYYNLNCNDFTTTLIDALKKGYSVSICGDISEPGIDSFNEGAYIPTFDVPQESLNDEARQMRLSNGSTTDDHCMHAVGWYFDGKHYWFLFKDSGAGGFDGANKGYRFVREDYVKLKMMNIMMHKDAAPILNKMIK